MGTATFYHPNAPERPWFSRPLHPEPTAAGQSPTSLDLIIGLSKAPQKGGAVVFEITGLPGKSGTQVTFKVPLEFVATATPATTAPEGSVSAGPRYIYGPGAYGYGYYAYPGPETLPQPAASTPTYCWHPDLLGLCRLDEWSYGGLDAQGLVHGAFLSPVQTLDAAQ